jgi:hypothetical protein
MEQIAQMITNYGFSAILLAWMIYKDYKFNDNIIKVLDKMQVVLGKLETWHNAEGGAQE